MPEDAFVILTKGSRYKIVSIETREKALVSHGTFKGYAAIGPDEAVCIELDESHKELGGKVRLIPCHMILSMVVVEQTEEEIEETKGPQRMYR